MTNIPRSFCGGLVALVLGGLLVAAGPAAAHDLIAPDQVFADGAGHFAYEMTLIIDPTVEFAFTEQNGQDNTDLGWWIGDGFCLSELEAGEYTIPVEGNLIDLALPGSVIHTEAMCDGWSETATTIILPPEVANDRRTWSSIKGTYR